MSEVVRTSPPIGAIAEARYGKAEVFVYREDGRAIFAARVRLEASGTSLLSAYRDGDNRAVVATDTMKNFLLAQAAAFPGDVLEEFLAFAGSRFLQQYPHIEAVRLEAEEIPFARERGVLYSRRHDDVGFAEVTVDRSGVCDHRLGRRRLHLIKLSGSAFYGFLRDAYTTLPEMHDRPLFIHLDVHYRHASFQNRVPTRAVRDLVVETFSDFYSQSIQHLVHEMGQRLLRRYPQIVEVTFDAENRLWERVHETESSRVYTDPRPPYGTIHLTLRRDGP
jgi:urate oxidase/2-oxo-4-hydroxy-4-carboxy-5-ureidoimidazoline decarboxylase